MCMGVAPWEWCVGVSATAPIERAPPQLSHATAGRGSGIGLGRIVTLIFTAGDRATGRPGWRRLGAVPDPGALSPFYAEGDRRTGSGQTVRRRLALHLMPLRTSTASSAGVAIHCSVATYKIFRILPLSVDPVIQKEPVC